MKLNALFGPILTRGGTLDLASIPDEHLPAGVDSGDHSPRMLSETALPPGLITLTLPFSFLEISIARGIQSLSYLFFISFFFFLFSKACQRRLAEL
jgi:hypothetical protein